MKLTSLLMTVACCSLLVATSCKKKSNNDHVRNDLMGTWAPVNEAKDLNGNAQLDADELIAPVLYNTHTLVYNADGTLNIMTQSNKLGGQLNWVLEQDNTYLKTTEIGSGAVVTNYHIDKITTSELVLKDAGGGTVQWYLFTKR